MGKNNTELLKIAEKYLGKNGRQVCGMTSNWCNAFVCKIFREGGDASLYYGGKMVTYCPTSIKWCQANLANIPIYLALPMDVIYFDWNANNVPDHIGFVRERKNDQEVRTIEGNTTSKYVVAYRTRPANKVLGCFRPAFKATWKDAPLVIDGYFGYNSIAMLQKALKKSGCYKDKIDGILGKNTVKALQKKAGVAQDGSWGKKTSKAVQKMCGLKGEDIDGAFGAKSTKALQTWINKQNGVTAPKPTPSKPAVKPAPKPTPSKPAVKTNGQKIADLATSYAYAGEPKESKYPSGHAKDAYKKGLNKAFPDRDSWSNAPRKGASCDVFVGTCVRNSGVDKKFPRGLAEQEKSLKKSGKFTDIKYNGDRSKLKAGDIVVMQYNNGRSGHICIVKNSKHHICEANLKSTYGITVKTKGGIDWRLKHRTGKDYCHVYRAK